MSDWDGSKYFISTTLREVGLVVDRLPWGDWDLNRERDLSPRVWILVSRFDHDRIRRTENHHRSLASCIVAHQTMPCPPGTCKHRPLADFFARSKTYSSMDLAPPGVVRRCPTPLSMQGYPQCLWSLKLEGPPICPTIYKFTRGNEQGILSGSGHAVRHLFRSLRRSEASVKYKRPSNSRSSSAYPRSYTWRSHDVNPHLASILAMS